MSLLDQLERQAQERRQREEQEQALLGERQEYYRTHTAPAMRKIFDYLKTLSAHLKYLDRPHETHYTIPQYGQVTAAIQPEFTVRLSTEKGVRSEIQIMATGRIRKKSSPEVTLNAQQSESLDQVLRDYSFHGEKRTHQSVGGGLVGGTYRIYGDFLLRGTIQASIDSSDIELEFVNFNELGIHRRTVQSERVDDEFTDKLGRFLVGEDLSLLHEDEPGDFRAGIQERLQRGQQNKNMELLEYEIDQIDREERSKSSLGGRITQRFAFLAKRSKRENKPK